MAKYVRNKPLAVIDIGSNEIRLKIAQLSKGEVRILDSLSYPVGLGKDTYTSGEISFDKVEKTCSIIKNFMQVIDEYDASLYTVVGSTSLREATNKEYVIDRIKIKTGVDVRILDDSEEKLYIFQVLSYLISEKEKKSAAMVYLGSGNLGLSFWENGKIPLVKNIRIGSMRISQIFESLYECPSQYYRVVREYLKCSTDTMKSELQSSILENEGDKITDFITSGQEIALISQLCKSRNDGVFNYISIKNFNKFYDEIKTKTVDRISHDYKLSIEKAEVLLPAMCIYKHLLEFIEVDELTAVHVYLTDALLFQGLSPIKYAEESKEFLKSTVLFAKRTASKFHNTTKHYEQVEEFALDIFDKIRKLHGLGKKEKLLLQIAATLHGVGKFINEKEHYIHSYSIISGIDLIGLTNIEKEIIANIVYYHSSVVPEKNHENYMNLSALNRVLVSKLAAILRIADALDRSYEQKISKIGVKITEEKLILTVETATNPDLEKWAFDEKSGFFADVFGLKPILKIKRSE